MQLIVSLSGRKPKDYRLALSVE